MQQTTSRGLLKNWHDRASAAQRGHFQAAHYFSGLNYYIGVPVLVLSAVVGTSVFASLQTKLNVCIQIAVGLASVIAAILASLQTFLKFSDGSEKH